MGYERKLIALNPSCYNFYRPHSSYYIDFTEKIMRNAFYASSPTPKRLRAQAKSQIEKKTRQIEASLKICFSSTFYCSSSLETEIKRVKTHPVKM